MNAISKYAAVFSRSPAVVRKPTDARAVAAFMFPAMKPSFWKSPVAEAYDETVYITAGMSAHSMPSDAASRTIYADRIELAAVCDIPIGGGPSGKEDVPTLILQMIAEYVLENGILIGVGHTLNFQEPLAPNTVMSAVPFALLEDMDVKQISRCTAAQDLLNVVPITAAELKFLSENGLGALLDRFGSAGVLPRFDYVRASAV